MKPTPKMRVLHQVDAFTRTPFTPVTSTYALRVDTRPGEALTATVTGHAVTASTRD
ncbi:hypothetical protein ACFTWD_30180 [Streptomyces sp. NPDC056943]|uniref:hypothetical protein n=1 Tax=Streptomyces sp. NPDC056943 TaxID=3345971 RepID=UPI00363155AB